jgi:hypothetical protein
LLGDDQMDFLLKKCDGDPYRFSQETAICLA